jgi:hypothetical protein
MGENSNKNYNVSNLYLITFQVSSKNPGLPGLVFDDFDQLYTQILDTDLSIQEELEDAEQSEGEEETGETSEDYSKLPNAENIFEKKKTESEEDETSVLIQSIYEIDYRTILAIQKLTAIVYTYEEEARNEIQKYSNAFRRDQKCMKKIKDTYKQVMETKIKNEESKKSQKDTKCPEKLKAVKFFC